MQQATPTILTMNKRKSLAKHCSDTVYEICLLHVYVHCQYYYTGKTTFKTRTVWDCSKFNLCSIKLEGWTNDHAHHSKTQRKGGSIDCPLKLFIKVPQLRGTKWNLWGNMLQNDCYCTPNFRVCNYMYIQCHLAGCILLLYNSHPYNNIVFSMLVMPLHVGVEF